ncbi:MAG: L,D-transpeptidase [Hyphomicrobiales bacterium]|nr:L,D-transpeptidase [Hyphomicrobiales bacterium]
MDRRRAFRHAVMAALACATISLSAPASASAEGYGAVQDGKFYVPGVNARRFNPKFLRQRVAYATSEPAGTIVIDPQNHFLYLVEGGGSAMRYGVAVGKAGFAWNGVASIGSKQHWPDWYPPQEMLDRSPELMRKMTQLRSGIGMAGGPRNPLGARALYLWQGGKDTLFRIHGTVEPWSIGTNASSGCIRMINQDAMDLYDRVPVGAKVVVLGTGSSAGMSLSEAQQPRDLEERRELSARKKHARRSARHSEQASLVDGDGPEVVVQRPRRYAAPQQQPQQDRPFWERPLFGGDTPDRASGW